ncbi:MAG: hypothetical protein CL535_16210 [Ahrensia sp.]|nr:hypothetical protein [Ahrensia sp.]MBV48217.1 hypothetical protein [Roseobacter sp.]|tara:strand:+ start:100154 stop:100474 length:321 start_codon:yes stop_codon:yes gene_type:complete
MPTPNEIREQIATLEKQLREAEEAERKAALVGDAKRATALLTLMRESQKEIERLFPGTFSGEKWEAITPQAWPRDTSFKRAADLSETEIQNARDAGKDAVAKLKTK